MNVGFTPATSRACLICDAPLSFKQNRSGPLCGRRECDWQYSLLRQQRRLCKICGRPLSLQQAAAEVCATPACQQVALKDFAHQVYQRNQARSAALIQQENEQAEQLRHQVLDDFGLQQPESYPLVVIPAFTAKAVNLPQYRRRTLREHLTALIAQAVLPSEAPASGGELESASTPAPAAPEVQTVMGLACSCCKGLCCTGGGDHAYLTVETIRRYMAEHPEQRPRDVLAAYLKRLSRQTYEGSCIFHQSDGCALSRNMRADLCNRHYCKALQAFHRNPPPPGPIRVFLVSAGNGQAQTAALVHQDQMLVIPAKLPKATEPATN